MDSPPQRPAGHAPGDSLANRYGRAQSDRPSCASRWGRWIAGAAVVIAVAVAAWFTLGPSKDSLSWNDVGSASESPTRASVTFQVTGGAAALLVVLRT